MDGIALKYSECRYCIRSINYEVWFLSFLCSICGCVGNDLRCAVSEIFYNPFIMSLGPWMTIFLLCLIFNSCYLNTAVHQTSQRLPIYMSEMCVRLGMMWSSHSESGKAGKSSKYGSLDCMVWKFYLSTWMGGTMFVDVQWGASACK